MNRIEFNLVGKEGYPGRSIEMLIDGTDLILKLRDFERRFIEDDARLAEYIMLDARNLGLHGYLYSQLRMKNIPHWVIGKPIIFECSCGCSGCWDMLVSVSRQGDKIIWSDFEQPSRGPDCLEFWDYSIFGPFEFDSQQYFGELEQARQQAIKLQTVSP